MSRYRSDDADIALGCGMVVLGYTLFWLGFVASVVWIVKEIWQ